MFLLENVSSKCSAGDEEGLPGKTRVFVQFKTFSINSGEKDGNDFFRKFIQNGLWARTFQFWHPWRSLWPKKEVFHPMSENGFKVIFFSRKTSIFSKCFSGHTECSFDNSAKTVPPKTWNFSLISQNSRIFGFSQKFFLETFNWSRKMPSWRPWSFPSSQNVLSKTMKRYKNLTSCREVFFKIFFWKHKVRLLHPWRKSLRKLWTFSAQSQKFYSKLRFREKYSLLRQIDSMVAWSAFEANMLVIFQQTTVHSSLRAV